MHDIRNGQIGSNFWIQHLVPTSGINSKPTYCIHHFVPHWPLDSTSNESTHWIKCMDPNAGSHLVQMCHLYKDELELIWTNVWIWKQQTHSKIWQLTICMMNLWLNKLQYVIINKLQFDQVSRNFNQNTVVIQFSFDHFLYTLYINLIVLYSKSEL